MWVQTTRIDQGEGEESEEESKSLSTGELNFLILCGIYHRKIYQYMANSLSHTSLFLRRNPRPVGRE